jgi:hypothetical protein
MRRRFDAGEQAAILLPGQWERVQSLIPQPTLARGGFRSQHQALLNGLLQCECCAAPMVYSYAAKGGRKYPYYVCRNAQQNGWAVCPSKSLPAQAIEESVLRRIGQVPGGIADATPWEQMDRTRQREAIEANQSFWAGHYSIGLQLISCSYIRIPWRPSYSSRP